MGKNKKGKSLKKRVKKLEKLILKNKFPLTDIYVTVEGPREIHILESFIMIKFPDEYDSYCDTYFEDIEDVFFHFTESCWHYGELTELAPEQENLMKKVTVTELIKNYL